MKVQNRPAALVAVAALLAAPCGCAFAGGDKKELARVQVTWGQTRTWNFDADEIGSLAKSWSPAETHGAGKTGAWKEVADAGAPSGPNLLQLQTENRGQTYNLCVLSEVRASDLDLSVALRADSGREDQGGGLIWRYQDENNYYIGRVNPLESNYRVYKVVDGRRMEMQSADVEVATGRWTTVRVVQVGDRIDCYLDGVRLLAVQDDTFSKPGAIGLWTKADACTSFDDVRIRAQSEEPDSE